MIGQVCIKPVVTASPETTIQAAARLMRTKNVGALVVAQNGKAKGFLTLDDLLMLLGSEMGNIASALSRGLGRAKI